MSAARTPIPAVLPPARFDTDGPPLPRSSLELVPPAPTLAAPRPAVHELPTSVGALLWPSLEALARDAMLHQPVQVATSWDTSLRSALTRLLALRRVGLAGTAATTTALLTHLTVEAAVRRGVPAVLAIAGESPTMVMRRVLAWSARVPHRAFVDGALDESQLRVIGRAASRLEDDVPLTIAAGHRRPDRAADALRGAVRWLLEHAGAARGAPAWLAVSLHGMGDPDLNAPPFASLRDLLCELAHEPRIRLLVALPFRGRLPVAPPMPALPPAWRALLDGTAILTGWPTGDAPVGGVTMHLERHVDGAVARAHAELHPSGRILPWIPPVPPRL
ncbi:MAG: hypothetical protein MUF00_14125 [Gemmatimonadaceae bacterium]|nr:hypothetical protein [Gemmatimonadaceae bacterium]